MDLRSRMLSRNATFLAVAAILLVLTRTSIARDDASILIVSMTAATVVVGGFALVHVMSSGSLGLGDVLLAAPLTLSVALAGIKEVTYWLLLATFSGSLHGIVLKFRTGKSQLPFGPHMLGSACLVLLLNL